MKKLIAFVLALVMALSLVACASSENKNSADGTTAAKADGNATVTTIEAGKLIMATNAEFPPYEMTDDDGNYIGIDVEIAEKIAEKLGLELEILDMAFDAALLAVNEGKSDIVMSGVSVTEDRKLVMDFSTTYTTAVQKVIIKEGSDVTLDNLGEKMIGTQEATSTIVSDIIAYLKSAMAPRITRHGVLMEVYGEGLLLDDHVNAYETGAIAIQALNNGQIDCVIIDSAPAAEFVKANPGLKLIDGDWVTEEYAIGFNKGNTQLVEAVNKCLAEMIADGTIDAINSKYITAE